MLALALLLAVQIAPQSLDTPNRQPQLAFDGKRVLLTYGAGNTIYFANSADEGMTWSTPVVVSSKGKLSLGMRRGPRIAVTHEAIVISAITDGELMAWRSVDGGTHWSDGKAVNDVRGSAREGLHAMASGGNNTLFVTWLDLRSKGTKLFGTISRDGGVTWSANRLVYESPSGSICECCHPTAVVDRDGRIHVMFRNSLQGNRDMYLVRSDDGGKTFGAGTKLGSGTWPLNACPMDGGALQIDSNGKPVTVWRRASDVFLASGTEQKLGPGRHPVIAITPAGNAVAWTEGKELKIMLPGQAEETTLDANAAFPSIVALSRNSVLLAWEQNGKIVLSRQ